MTGKLVLSHPRKFKTESLPVKSVEDSSQKASHKIDNKVLQAQGELVKDTLAGKVTLGEFCDTVKDLEALSALHAELRAAIAAYDRVVVAFSGGVDSSLVAHVAAEALGPRALAVTSGSPSLKRDDLKLAVELADRWGMRHEIIVTMD